MSPFGRFRLASVEQLAKAMTITSRINQLGFYMTLEVSPHAR
jgi:hypothetical protein